MSSGSNNNSNNNNIFPIMSGALTPEQLCTEGEVNGIVSADWYTPVSVCQILLRPSITAHRN
jgi:hypothetical protein